MSIQHFLPFHPFSAKYSIENVMMVSACLLAAAVLWTVVIGVGGVGEEERREERLRLARYVLTPAERADVSALVRSNHVRSTTADYASHVKRYKVRFFLHLTQLRAVDGLGF